MVIFPFRILQFTLALCISALAVHCDAQELTIINNYGDTTGLGKEGLRLSKTGTHTLIINYYEPAPSNEVDRLEELIGRSIDFYLDQVATIQNEKLDFKKSKNQVLKDLNEIVADAVKYYDFKEVNEFKGFSKELVKMVEDLVGKDWRKSQFYVKDADPSTKKEMLYYFAQKELNDIKLKANTEVGNYSNDNLLSLSETAVKGLDEETEKALLDEIRNFQKNDVLKPMEVDFSTATILLLASEDQFLMPTLQSSGKGPKEQTFEERVLRLLEQNNRRFDKLESDIAELKKERGSGLATGVRPSSDPEIQAQIDEIRLMLAELLKRERRPSEISTKPILSGEGATIYNLPDKIIFNFDKSKYNLNLGSTFMLNEIIDILAHQPQLDIMVTGFADRTGDAKLNLELSRKRAKMVRDYLIQNGINADRIVMNYFGDRESYSENPNDRKVEIEFLKF